MRTCAFAPPTELGKPPGLRNSWTELGKPPGQGGPWGGSLLEPKGALGRLKLGLLNQSKLPQIHAKSAKDFKVASCGKCKNYPKTLRKQMILLFPSDSVPCQLWNMFSQREICSPSRHEQQFKNTPSALNTIYLKRVHVWSYSYYIYIYIYIYISYEPYKTPSNKTPTLVATSFSI